MAPKKIIKKAPPRLPESQKKLIKYPTANTKSLPEEDYEYF